MKVLNLFNVITGKQHSTTKNSLNMVSVLILQEYAFYYNAMKILNRDIENPTIFAFLYIWAKILSSFL